MEIWQLNEDTIRKGRPISRITEATIFREAEMIFNCEIGHALGCSAVFGVHRHPSSKDEENPDFSGLPLCFRKYSVSWD